MTKPCSICTSAYREAIDRRLLNGATLRELTEEYGLSKSALSRHRAEHLNLALIKAAPVEVIVENAGILDQLRSLHGRTLRVLADAETSRDGRLAAIAIREARGNLELLAKIDLILSDREAAKQAKEEQITVTFDHEDMTPDRRGPVAIYLPYDGRSKLDVKDELAAKIEGMIMNRKNEILGDKQPQVDGQSMMGEFALLEAIMDLREMCKAAGITAESLKRSTVSENVSPVPVNGATSGPGSVAKQHNFATQPIQTNPVIGGPVVTPPETDTTGTNREQSLDDADNDADALEATRQAVATISARMIQADAPIAFIIDHVRQQGVDEAKARRLLSVLVERGIIVMTRPDSYRPMIRK